MSDGDDTLRVRLSFIVTSNTRQNKSPFPSIFQPTMLRLPTTTRSAPREENLEGTDFMRI